MIRFPRPFRRGAAWCGVLLAATACADRNPTSAPPGPAPEPAGPVAALRCAVDLRAATLSCREAREGASPGVRSAILGGQGLNVRIASSGTAYDAGTGILRSDVTVENLTTQMLGTTEGTLPAPEGVRVLFESGPVVTAGSGTVAVANADGEDVFTAAGQRYFRYAGVLAPGDTTGPREWRFSVSPTVVSFAFTVYVAAPVAREGGWVSLTPLAAALGPGDTLRLAAVVHSATGRPVEGARVTWSLSSTDTTATIDSTGLLTVHQSGFVNVRASSGGREGFVSLLAIDPLYQLPSVAAVEISPARVDGGSADSVTVRVAASDRRGILSVSVELFSPAGRQPPRTCRSLAPASGTPTHGVFVCRLNLPAGSIGGVWQVRSVTVAAPGGTRLLMDYDLLLAGVRPTVYVRGPLSDYIPPTLTSFTFSPDSVRTVLDPVTIDAEVADADTGVASVETDFVGSDGIRLGCGTAFLARGTIRGGMFRCRMRIPGFVQGYALQVLAVRVRDRNGNVQEVSGGELQSRGYPTLLKLMPDTVRPVITAFSFAPATVAANGVDSVSLTLSATDALSGVRLVEARFGRVGTPGERNCIEGFTAVPSHTMRCALRFGPGEAGTWRLLYIRVMDDANATRELDATQAQAAGYPTELTVTPP